MSKSQSPWEKMRKVTTMKHPNMTLSEWTKNKKIWVVYGRDVQKDKWPNGELWAGKNEHKFVFSQTKNEIVLQEWSECRNCWQILISVMGEKWNVGSFFWLMQYVCKLLVWCTSCGHAVRRSRLSSWPCKGQKPAEARCLSSFFPHPAKPESDITLNGSASIPRKDFSLC